MAACEWAVFAESLLPPCVRYARGANTRVCRVRTPANAWDFDATSYFADSTPDGTFYSLTGMNTQHLEKRLRDKERELESTLAGLEGEGRVSGEAEVRDSIDEATASQGASESFGESTLLSHTLEQVRDALRRIQDGAYGTCTVCGRQIEPARLEAVPWTPYCLEDQQKQDRKI